jgi:hypothetical protein
MIYIFKNSLRFFIFLQKIIFLKINFLLENFNISENITISVELAEVLLYISHLVFHPQECFKQSLNKQLNFTGRRKSNHCTNAIFQCAIIWPKIKQTNNNIDVAIMDSIIVLEIIDLDT